jgi:prolyl-tRNA synthetase
VFNRLGLDYRIVEADAGNIGGNLTHEFQVLADAGEDKLMLCNKCDFAANIEVAPSLVTENPKSTTAQNMEEFDTPGLKTIEDLSKSLKVEAKDLIKTMFFSVTKDKKTSQVAVLLRGSDEVNPIKLKNFFGASDTPVLLNENEVLAVTGARPGSCGPVGLKIPIYIDTGVEHMSNSVVGANKDDKHLRNVNRGRDYKEAGISDFKMANEGDLCPKCKKGTYITKRGIEVGHVFYLGNKYSKAMGATFLNKEGKVEIMEMGCYGIGVSRTL